MTRVSNGGQFQSIKLALTFWPQVIIVARGLRIISSVCICAATFVTRERASWALLGLGQWSSLHSKSPISSSRLRIVRRHIFDRATETACVDLQTLVSSSAPLGFALCETFVQHCRCYLFSNPKMLIHCAFDLRHLLSIVSRLRRVRRDESC